MIEYVSVVAEFVVAIVVVFEVVAEAVVGVVTS